MLTFVPVACLVASVAALMFIAFRCPRDFNNADPEELADAVTTRLMTQEHAELRQTIRKLEQEISNLTVDCHTANHEREEWKAKAVSLRSGKAIWDAADRLERDLSNLQDQLAQYRGEIQTFKRAVGSAYEMETTEQN